MLEVARHEILDEELVDGGTPLVAGEGPDVVGQESQSPMFRLGEQNNRWPRTPLALAEGRGRSRWKQEARTEAPNQLTGVGRRQEEAGVEVAESVRAAVARRVQPRISQMSFASSPLVWQAEPRSGW